MSDFYRFPHIPHLAWFGVGKPRDDKVLSATETGALLSADLVVEEKLDGANLGLSIGNDGRVRAQSRGQYLETPYSGQFSRLGSWVAAHEERLFIALGEHLIAFGEWCAARHSIEYTALPDWWVLFDIYDKVDRRFWSTTRRDAWAGEVGVPTVAAVLRGRASLLDLEALLATEKSIYRDGPMEGLIVRVEDENWLGDRAKLVRADFTQSIDAHWRTRHLEWNRLRLLA